MARKKLLSESEIRQFMKLANIKPLQEMGGYMPGMRDEEEDEPGMRDTMMEEEGDEEMDMEMDAEEPAEEGGDEEMDMDMDMGGDEEMDMGVDDMDMGADGGKEEHRFLVPCILRNTQLWVRPREVHDACQPPPNPRRAHERRGDVLQIHVVVGVVDSERATVCATGAVAEYFGYTLVTKQPSHVVAEPVDVRDLEEA